MDNDYAAHLRLQIAAKKLQAYRHRQEKERLEAAANTKLATQFGRAVLLRMHEPAMLAAVKLIAPTLSGRPGRLLQTALRAVEPDLNEEVPPAAS